jgi:hypothetical protein
MKRTPAKARAKVSGVQMRVSILNENSKRSVTGPRKHASLSRAIATGCLAAAHFGTGGVILASTGFRDRKLMRITNRITNAASQS